MWTRITLGCFLFASFAGLLQAEPTKKITDQELLDFRGASVKLSDYAGEKGTVVAFLGVDCPLVKGYSLAMQRFADSFEPQGVKFVAINSNQQDSLAEMADFVRDYSVRFPMLKDAGNKLADQFGARRTPEFFVLNAAREVVYSGRINDQLGVGFQRPTPTREDLAMAVEEMLAGKPISVPATEALGCYIGRAKPVAAKGEVTYASHIAAILQKRCLECHRPGEIGPFALESFEDAVAWSDTIQEVVREERMPPWFADPKVGSFLHDPRLSDEEKTLIDRWVALGCPKGDESAIPSAPGYVDGWLMKGEPDIVYYMDEKPFKVPAEGTLDYIYYEIDPKWDEDRWILGSEARAGNRSVVHHILIFAKHPGKWYPPGLPGELISAYAPGMKPTVGADDTMALRIPKGTKFVMQMHYTANGRPQEDLSYFGLKLAKDPSKIEWEIKPGMAINLLFRIPPGDPNYRVPGMFSFAEDSLLLGVNPHMHMRGKSFVYNALYPDGRRETIMNCPKYDFNWQLGYQYTKPLFMPKGTKLLCDGFFDNSTGNKSNPDPKRAVRFGEQTWDEMMIGWFYYAVKRPNAVASN